MLPAEFGGVVGGGEAANAELEGFPEQLGVRRDAAFADAAEALQARQASGHHLWPTRKGAAGPCERSSRQGERLKESLLGKKGAQIGTVPTGRSGFLPLAASKFLAKFPTQICSSLAALSAHHGDSGSRYSSANSPNV